jgi:hypothetical protein
MAGLEFLRDDVNAVAIVGTGGNKENDRINAGRRNID